MWLARAGVLAARSPVAAEHDQACTVVGHDLAERIDGAWGEAFGRERRGVIAFAAAVERGPPLVLAIHDARPGIDDQAVAIVDAGIAQRMIVGVAVFTIRLLEFVPARLFVGDVDLPLDVDQRAGVAAAFDVVTDFQGTSLGRLLVVDIDLEARGLSLDASLRVLESGLRLHRLAVRGEQGIALNVFADALTTSAIVFLQKGAAATPMSFKNMPRIGYTTIYGSS